jgi:hypothetical protein
MLIYSQTYVNTVYGTSPHKTERLCRAGIEPFRTRSWCYNITDSESDSDESDEVIIVTVAAAHRPSGCQTVSEWLAGGLAPRPS